jgi:hypothetical protein
MDLFCTDKLPISFRTDPKISEILQKKKTRRIKFPDDEHIAEIHYFNSK